MEMLMQGKLHILKWWASIKKNVNYTHITKRAWTAYRNKYTDEIIQCYFVQDIKNNYSFFTIGTIDQKYSIWFHLIRIIEESNWLEMFD